VKVTNPYARDGVILRKVPRPDPALLPQPPAVPPTGQIRLTDKAIPSCDLHPDVAQRMTWCVTRADVDCTLLLQKLEREGPSVWEEAVQRRQNVWLSRSAHDAWGIQKIAFVFCDDFMRRVLQFPWFHDPGWRAALQPIFDALSVPRDRVVRALLTALPPNVAIPVHYDTGAWVQQTHRIHVPVITSDRVVFRVGPRRDALRRLAFDVGKAIELNNSAVHAVDNLGDQPRVHLIFDYCEADQALSHTVCQVGEELVQTRRSVDRACEAGSRTPPSWILLGAQKCGTTSVYSHLCRHPLGVRARLRETHFFDWAWPAELKSTEARRAAYHERFDLERLTRHPSLMTGESTPSYLLGGPLVIDRIREVAPHAKLIVLLRDPAARAYSQYQMTIDPEGTAKQRAVRGRAQWQGRSFRSLVEEELALLKQIGLTADSEARDFVERYLPRVLGLRHGGHSLLARGLYALQLEPWLEAFGRDAVLVLRTEDMSTAAGAQAVMDQVFSFVGLPQAPLLDPRPLNTRAYKPMALGVQGQLQAFFAPYNRRLEALLGWPEGWTKTPLEPK